eukprot:TRINITY_DN1852_c0_g1_i2.p1 TRINITY_DN1852_c0_g1~~TRINITY_DN1852_c0_g1_i2.p1  ORF type:complete len:104 (-),score=16.67 TRINITY_DN1852_c0_g1_i2:173-484(-)
MKTVIVLLAVIFAVTLALGENSRPSPPQNTNARNSTRKQSDLISVNRELSCGPGCKLVKRCGPSHCNMVGKSRICTKDHRCRSVCSCPSEKNRNKENPKPTKA